MPFPTAGELITFLGTLSGFEGRIPIEARATELLEAAIDEFERRTHRRPFLATTTTRTFAAPCARRPMGILIDLDGWTILGSPTEVRTLGSGRILAEGRDYRLHDTSAGDDECPYEAIALAGWPDGGKIEVDATFGYTAEISGDVREAILGKAAALHAAKIQGPAGIQKKVKQGPVEYELDVEAGRSGLDRWTSDFDRLVQRLRRL